VSCGVLVTDGAALLVGRFTGLALWDIPKGLAEPGEAHHQAAARELREETGLIVPPGVLRPLGGVRRYRPGKDLALFLWRRAPGAMPDPAGLHCTSRFRTRDGRWLPELDAFAAPPWEEALNRVGGSMRRVLGELRDEPGWRAAWDEAG
jgi:8-oxo-dGTP pyrophosphatase MutT (NUDIX family)